VQEIHPLYHHLKVTLEVILKEGTLLQEAVVLQQQELTRLQDVMLHPQLVVREQPQ
tara:strand:- start:303 stop:470 length:168 start_codon:yes stop_codon:yes gene_type:complete